MYKECHDISPTENGRKWAFCTPFIDACCIPPNLETGTGTFLLSRTTLGGIARLYCILCCCFALFHRSLVDQKTDGRYEQLGGGVVALNSFEL